MKDGAGPAGALATLTIERRGRALAKPPATIGWHDRKRRAQVFGGHIDAGGANIAVEAGDGDVWPDPQQLQSLDAAPSPEAFEEAMTAAKRAKGLLQSVDLSVRAGDEVFVVGAVQTHEGHMSIRPMPDGTFLVSRVDPVRWARQARRASWAFSAVIVLVAAGLTVLATWPPAFGAWSTVGGAALLGFFLLVQPAGTWNRDRVREPSRKRLEGAWTLPRGELKPPRAAPGLPREARRES
ncbi:MAG: hypothetical protein HC915_16190 [Anaerolineae bacterium]|nr:hypothetical protein [Anaerolineae bacterium]